MIFAFILAHRNFAENVSWKRVKNGFAKAVLRRNALEMLIGFVLVLLLVLVLELRTTPGTIPRACWSSIPHGGMVSAKNRPKPERQRKKR
jgi:hypothetical protein